MPTSQTIGWIFDGITVLIILFALIRGTLKGFVDTVFDMGRFVASIVVASVFTEPAANLVSGMSFFAAIKERVAQTIENAMTNVGQNLDPTEALSKFLSDNPGLEKVFGILDIRTETLSANLATSLESGTKSAAEAIKQSVAEPAVNAILNVAVFLLLFVLTLIALWIVKKILDAVTEIPGIKSVNRAGGFILGAAAAVLYASLFCLLCEKFAAGSVILGASIPADISETTCVYGFFVKYNLFTALGKILGM